MRPPYPEANIVRVERDLLMQQRRDVRVPERQSTIYHNDTVDKQGGALAEYYHLVTADYTALTDAAAQLTALHTHGSPTFAGATIGSLAGYIKGAAGVLSGQTGVPYGDLTYSGLTAGYVLRASGAAAAAFAAIQDGDLPSSIMRDSEHASDAHTMTLDGVDLSAFYSAYLVHTHAYAADSLAFVTIGNIAGLSAERALTGTANQITVTDNGANSTVVLSIPATLAVGSDTDATITFGRAKIGYNATHSDYATFAHLDAMSSVNYALIQGAAGDTYVNAASGQAVKLRINNSDIAAVLAGGFGVGTITVPHGAVGAAKLAIDGTNASTAGPHIQLTTAADDYPLIQLLGYAHHNVGLIFDAYWDGTWKSSQANSNFMLYKDSNGFRIMYDANKAQGAAVSWSSAFAVGSSGTCTFGGNALPDGASTRDLGSTSAGWANLYIGTGRAYFGATQQFSIYVSGTELIIG